MKRFLLTILVFIVYLSSHASVYVEGLNYSLDEGSKEAIVLSGQPFGHLEIPEAIEYEGENYKVTVIASSAFSCCTNLTSVNIPNTVRKIGMWAFMGCKNLTSITIPASVSEIGAHPLALCSSLKAIKVEKDNPTYDSRDDCNAIVVTLTNTIIAGCVNTSFPSTVTGIAVAAFQGCDDMESLTIPSTITHIEPTAFHSCSHLRSITVEKDNPVYDSREDCNAIIETATNTLIAACCRVRIPETVKRIGTSAFQGCIGLTSLEIPNSVTHIGEYAFYCMSDIKSIKMSNSIDTIGSFAFGGCHDLRNLELPSTLLFIGNGAFFICRNLTDIYNYSTVPVPITSQYTFDGTYGATLHVPKGCKDVYMASSYWMNFNIVDDIDETTKVAALSSRILSGNERIYSTSGQRIKEKRQGISLLSG